MGSSDAFIRATVNRLGARLGHGLADAAAEIAVLAQDAPERLRREWQLFQEEVRAEADRLERGESSEEPVSEPMTSVQTPEASPQELVDRLRASVAEINRSIEAGF